MASSVRNTWFESPVTDEVLKRIDTAVQTITFAHLRWTYEFDPHSTLPEIVSVRPNQIEWKSTLPRRVFPTKDSEVERDDVPYLTPIVGEIGGLWDFHRRGWDASSHHQSLERRFVDGQPWEHTSLYRTNLAKIRRGERGQTGVSTLEELDRRCADLDRLYESIRDNGYRTSQELLEDPTSHESGDPEQLSVQILGESYPGECRVGIGRRGEIIRFSAGRHRVSIAKILNVESVPVILVARHKKWNRIRASFSDAGSISDVPRRHRKFATHPDIRYHHPD